MKSAHLVTWFPPGSHLVPDSGGKGHLVTWFHPRRGEGTLVDPGERVAKSGHLVPPDPDSGAGRNCPTRLARRVPPEGPPPLRAESERVERGSLPRCSPLSALPAVSYQRIRVVGAHPWITALRSPPVKPRGGLHACLAGDDQRVAKYETAQFLDGPRLARWCRARSIEPQTLGQVRSLNAWTKGERATLASIDRMLLDTDYSLFEIPDRIWL